MDENEVEVSPDEASGNGAPPIAAKEQVPEATSERETQAEAGAEEFLPAMDVALPESESAASPPPPAPRTCPHCQAPRGESQTFCGDCGLVFPDEKAFPPTATASLAPAPVVRGRYEVHSLITEFGGVACYHGRDLGEQHTAATPIVIVRAEFPRAAEPVFAAEEAQPVPEGEVIEAEVLPTSDAPPGEKSAAEGYETAVPAWPGIGWEHALLKRLAHPALPRVRDHFSEDGYEYLVEEVPAGRGLWDAWDDPESTNAQRYGWLRQIAEALQQLHRGGVLLESFRPELFVVSAEGRARLTGLAELLPLPLPPNPPLHGSLYAAPELVLSGDKADARANLYTFGAMLYSLLVGRELTEADFDRHGSPRPFLPSFPDIHPALGRLIAKTFCRDVAGRFPSEEAQKEDATGFMELARTLDACGRALDAVRLDIAAWTTTGMVRTGNEDAFALLHAVESRQDELRESALVLLADGMGGTEAGEVAAALAVQSLRRQLLGQELFAGLAGNAAAPFDLDAAREAITAALKGANSEVFQAARSGQGKPGMGCTAEVVFVSGHQFVVGHVGDSRTYHFHERRVTQLTRDQTLVNRLVELGSLSPEEAETHPRRSELQQAIGGREDVEPAVYDGKLTPGDWLLVCSDGLTNHVRAEELQEMLQGEAASAETAARRLVNFANLRGATDNATVVVIRAT